MSHTPGQEAACTKCGEMFMPANWQIQRCAWRCRACSRLYEQAYRARRIREGNPIVTGKHCLEKDRIYERGYRERPGVREHRAAQAKVYRLDPRVQHKNKARWTLNKAVAKGAVIRGPCEACGSGPAEGHHPDYSKPLDVMWLCMPCHHALHRTATAMLAEREKS